MDEEEEEEELGQMPGGNLSDNFATYSRLRANTWPLNRFDETNNKTSQDPEDAEGSHPESSPDGTEGSGGGRHNFSGSSTGIFIPSPNPGGTLLNAAEIPSSTSADTSTSPVGSGTNQTSPAKKNSSRRNAWGNLSYADLITQAITSTPEQRLTLSQIYDWIVQNVAFFKDKGDNNSSAGWKNSVRHNLSLHNRFMRVQNEGTGKSSWWMINPDAKPGKSTRRRAASMETQKYEKRRGRVKKQLEEQRRLGGESGLGLGLTLRNPSSPISESTECLFPLAGSHSNLAIIGNDSSAPKQLSPMHTLHAGLVEGFRSRSGSNASSFGRLSPFEEQHTPSYSPQQWMAEYEYNNSGTLRNSQIKSESKAELAELDSLAHSMRLNDSAYGLDGHNLKTSTDLRTQSPRIISAQTPPFYPPWIQTQKSGGKDGAVNATGGKVDLSSLCNPTSNSGYSLSSIHTSIFSGGTSTFTSIPDESDRPPTHTTPTRNVSAPNLPQFLPSIHIRPSLSTRFPVPPQTSSQSRSENTGPGQNDNLFNGQFPADLEMIPMDTTGPSTFEGFNDEILNEVLKQELREEGNLNFDDLEELGECFRGNGNGFVNGGLGGGVSSMPHSSSGTIGLSFTTPKSTVRPTYVRQP